jgi:DNA-binding NarL/FixJ family response regulator
MSGPRTSVVIVDDHALFRAGVRSELEELVDVRADAAPVGVAVAVIVG